MRALCKKINFFNSYLYRAGRVYEFADTVKLPRHFKVLDAIPEDPEVVETHPTSRDLLEARATELGIPFTVNWRDDTLEKKIEAAEKKLEAAGPDGDKE